MDPGAGQDAGPPSGPAPKVTYTFDHIAVTTTRVTTDAGEDAARRAADGLISISVQAAPGDLDVEGNIPDGVAYDPAYISPRGRAYLVEAVSENGTEIAVSSAEFIPEPISGDSREDLARLVAAWREAADSPSGDGEHSAAEALADAVSSLVGPGRQVPAGLDPGSAAPTAGPGQAVRPKGDSRRGNRAGSRRGLPGEGTAQRGRGGSR